MAVFAKSMGMRTFQVIRHRAFVDGIASVATRIDGAGSGEFVQTVPGRRLERLNGRKVVCRELAIRGL